MKRLFCIAAGMALAASAQAQSSKPAPAYLTLSGGGSSYNVDCAGTSSCDKSGSAVRLLGGYRLNSNLGVEGIYMNLGQSKASVNTPGVGLINAKVKSSFFGGGVAGYLPFGTGFEAAARLGLASVDTKLSGSIGSGVVVPAASERKAKLYAGLSLSYAFSQSLAADVSWDSTNFEVIGEKATVTALTVGLSLRF